MFSVWLQPESKRLPKENGAKKRELTDAKRPPKAKGNAKGR
jgi:hypothetical protein